MASLCIHNAKVVTGTIASGGVLIEDGRIAACLHGNDRASADVIIDARSRLLFPGFVDAHVHMRDPGQPQKEERCGRGGRHYHRDVHAQHEAADRFAVGL